MRNSILATSTDLRRVSLFALRFKSAHLVETFLKEAAKRRIPKQFMEELKRLNKEWTKVAGDEIKRKTWSEEALTLAARLYHRGLAT